MIVTIGSLFSGIGGLELGVEMAVPGARVIWQAEIDPRARAVLAQHWPDVRRYNDAVVPQEAALAFRTLIARAAAAGGERAA